MKMFANKVVLIVGGSSGIGLAAARGFATEGAKVVLASRTSETGEGAAATVRASGGEAIFIRTDTAKEVDVREAVTKTVDAYGRLDIAFNNAGYEGPSKPLAEQETEDFEQIVDINLKGVFLAMKYQIRQMLKQGGGGAIVNTSSIAGVVGMPQGSIYAAGKHGVIGLSKSAALEYAEHGIRINTISPAATDTPMLERYIAAHPHFGPSREAKTRFGQRYPVKRIGTALEVAQAAIWLASDHASFIVGENIVIDGGITVG